MQRHVIKLREVFFFQRQQAQHRLQSSFITAAQCALSGLYLFTKQRYIHTYRTSILHYQTVCALGISVMMLLLSVLKDPTLCNVAVLLTTVYVNAYRETEKVR